MNHELFECREMIGLYHDGEIVVSELISHVFLAVVFCDERIGAGAKELIKDSSVVLLFLPFLVCQMMTN